MDVIAAYREAGTFGDRGHVQDTHKTVKRIIEAPEAGAGPIPLD